MFPIFSVLYISRDMYKHSTHMLTSHSASIARDFGTSVFSAIVLYALQQNILYTLNCYNPNCSCVSSDIRIMEALIQQTTEKDSANYRESTKGIVAVGKTRPLYASVNTLV